MGENIHIRKETLINQIEKATTEMKTGEFMDRLNRSIDDLPDEIDQEDLDRLLGNYIKVDEPWSLILLLFMFFGEF